MSEPIHALVLCSSAFAKLTLGSDKAILITGVVLLNRPAPDFLNGRLVIVVPHFASAAVSFESFSQHCHFTYNRLRHEASCGDN